LKKRSKKLLILRSDIPRSASSKPHTAGPAPYPPPRHRGGAGVSIDPRRETLRSVIDYTTESLPNRAQLRTEAEILIETELQNDPEAETPLTTLLDAITGQLTMRLDCSRMPDKLLESLVPGGFAAAARATTEEFDITPCLNPPDNAREAGQVPYRSPGLTRNEKFLALFFKKLSHRHLADPRL